VKRPVGGADRPSRLVPCRASPRSVAPRSQRWRGTRAAQAGPGPHPRCTGTPGSTALPDRSGSRVPADGLGTPHGSAPAGTYRVAGEEAESRAGNEPRRSQRHEADRPGRSGVRLGQGVGLEAIDPAQLLAVHRAREKPVGGSADDERREPGRRRQDSKCEEPAPRRYQSGPPCSGRDGWTAPAAAWAPPTGTAPPDRQTDCRTGAGPTVAPLNRGPRAESSCPSAWRTAGWGPSRGVLGGPFPARGAADRDGSCAGARGIHPFHGKRLLRVPGDLAPRAHAVPQLNPRGSGHRNRGARPTTLKRRQPTPYSVSRETTGAAEDVFPREPDPSVRHTPHLGS
jgi:hypothetical protein